MSKHLAIKVNNKYEPEAVQKALFDMGFKWVFGDDYIYPYLPLTIRCVFQDKSLTDFIRYRKSISDDINYSDYELTISSSDFFSTYVGHIERFPDYVEPCTDHNALKGIDESTNIYCNTETKENLNEEINATPSAQDSQYNSMCKYCRYLKIAKKYIDENGKEKQELQVELHPDFETLEYKLSKEELKNIEDGKNKTFTSFAEMDKTKTLPRCKFCKSNNNCDVIIPNNASDVCAYFEKQQEPKLKVGDKLYYPRGEFAAKEMGSGVDEWDIVNIDGDMISVHSPYWVTSAAHTFPAYRLNDRDLGLYTTKEAAEIHCYKLLEPKFKVGDKLFTTLYPNNPNKITEISIHDVKVDSNGRINYGLEDTGSLRVYEFAIDNGLCDMFSTREMAEKWLENPWRNFIDGEESNKFDSKFKIGDYLWKVINEEITRLIIVEIHNNMKIRVNQGDESWDVSIKGIDNDMMIYSTPELAAKRFLELNAEKKDGK